MPARVRIPTNAVWATVIFALNIFAFIFIGLQMRPILVELAPDQRGYGRTTGWDADYDGDLASFRLLNLVRDALGLVAAFGYRSVDAVVGHDFGSFVAAWCALVRPDVFRAVALMSATLGIGGALGLPLGGTLFQQFGWTSVFWVSVVVGVAIQQNRGRVTFGEVANAHVRVAEGYTELSRNDLGQVPDATAVTVAERGPGSNSDSSPNICPGPRIARRFSRPSELVRPSFTLPSVTM